jgi:hypothetical protein
MRWTIAALAVPRMAGFCGIAAPECPRMAGFRSQFTSILH